MHALNAWHSPNVPAHKWGGGGGPPRGNSIRRPPKVCQRRARLTTNWLCPIAAGQSRHSFAHFDLKCSFPYPFLSPGAWGPPQTRRQKAEKFGFFAFLVDFFAFRNALQKRLRKNIEKSAKIEDFGLPRPSQNPPKKPSKSKVQKNSVFSCIFHINSTYFLPRFS